MDAPTTPTTTDQAAEDQLLVARRSADAALRRLRLQQQVTGICARATHARGLLEEVGDALAHGLGATGIATWLDVRVAPGTYGLVARRGVAEAVAPHLLDARELGVAGKALMHGDVVVAASSRHVPKLFGAIAGALTREGHQAVVAVPFVHDGQCLGIGLACFADPWRGTDEEQRDLRSIGALTGQTIARISLQERLSRLSTHDTLTGLPNPQQFRDHTAQALARAARKLAPVSVLLVDLDGFKELNDKWGIAAGDVVLRRSAERICNAVRDVDVVARLSSDQFAVLCEDSDRDAVSTVARRVRRAMAVPIKVNNQHVRIGASLGIAVHDGSRADTDPESLLAEADRAMHRAKETRRAAS